MKKQIPEFGGYVITNPFYQREPFKNIFMRRAYLVYRKIRMAIARFIPLKEWQKLYWENERCPLHVEPNCAENLLAKDEEADISPIFRIDNIAITELIPKEEMPSIERGIKRFHATHCQNGMFDSFSHTTDYFNKFDDGFAFTHLGSFLISQKSPLFQFISQIHFRVVNVSDTFCSFIVHIYLNKELQERIVAYATGHVDEQFEITGFERYNWYQFRHLTYGEFSGAIHKCTVINDILSDVVWNLDDKLCRCIPSLLFHSQKILPPYICTVYSNIDGNSNAAFWRSVGIDSRFCDFRQNYSACIAWRHEGQPFFIWNSTKNIDTSTNNDITAYHLPDTLCLYLIADAIDKSFREKLVEYSKRISKLKCAGVRRWLKLKVKMDTEMYYYMRFLNEYHLDFRESEFNEYSSLGSDKPLIAKLYSYANKRIEKTKSLFNGIDGIFQSNIDYRNAKSNYRLQKMALIVAIISIFVAIIAIVISVETNEQSAIKLAEWWQNIRERFSIQ